MKITAEQSPWRNSVSWCSNRPMLLWSKVPKKSSPIGREALLLLTVPRKTAPILGASKLFPSLKPSGCRGGGHSDGQTTPIPLHPTRPCPAVEVLAGGVYGAGCVDPRVPLVCALTQRLLHDWLLARPQHFLCINVSTFLSALPASGLATQLASPTISLSGPQTLGDAGTSLPQHPQLGRLRTPLSPSSSSQAPPRSPSPRSHSALWQSLLLFVLSSKVGISTWRPDVLFFFIYIYSKIKI